MSRRSTVASATAAHCKVCKDAGLPPTAYGNHNLRDIKGRICCPTIKNNHCHKCDKLGHFAKFCTAKSGGGGAITSSRQEKAAFKESPKETKTVTNLFDCLGESSDEDEEKQPKVKVSWADMSDDEDDW